MCLQRRGTSPVPPPTACDCGTVVMREEVSEPAGRHRQLCMWISRARYSFGPRPRWDRHWFFAHFNAPSAISKHAKSSASVATARLRDGAMSLPPRPAAFNAVIASELRGRVTDTPLYAASRSSPARVNV